MVTLRLKVKSASYRRFKWIFVAIPFLLILSVAWSASLFGDVHPVATKTYDLGSSAKYWQTCYCMDYHGNATNMTGVITYNASYDAKPNNTYNSTYDEFTRWTNATSGIGLDDNIKIFLGSDDDVCIYWDGTSLIITDSC